MRHKVVAHKVINARLLFFCITIIHRLFKSNCMWEAY